MKANIITIGDEILIGQTIDTNSAWISNLLERNGIHVVQIISISDKKDHIVFSLSQSLERSDIVLITGGLGPTKDDITKQTLCEYFDDELILNHSILDDITKYFDSRKRTVNKFTESQAFVPSKCKVIRNRKGTAPGMWFEHNGKIVVWGSGSKGGKIPSSYKRLEGSSLLSQLFIGKKNSNVFSFLEISILRFPDSPNLLESASCASEKEDISDPSIFEIKSPFSIPCLNAIEFGRTSPTIGMIL